MKLPVSRLSAFAQGKNVVHVVIETPKCSRIKYSYDAKTGLMRVKRALPEGMAFPFNFGFIPSTLGEDGDAVDILILNQEALATGCYLVARLLGVIEAEQTEGKKMTRNDRLIGMALPKETPSEFEEIELTKKVCTEIEHFFAAYNQLDGKKFKVLGQRGLKQAQKMVWQGIKRAKKSKGKK
ncbi:MAG TPA: inorganic diphosphatase [Candidatus Saccharimonadales bacterium]|nr:inorganic diphosphatase [Candidatus Saccharimonadales bacterium]